MYFFSPFLMQKQRKSLLSRGCTSWLSHAPRVPLHVPLQIAHGQGTEGFRVMCLPLQTAFSLRSESLFSAPLMLRTMPSRQQTFNKCLKNEERHAQSHSPLREPPSVVTIQALKCTPTLSIKSKANKNKPYTKSFLLLYF